RKAGRVSLGLKVAAPTNPARRKAGRVRLGLMVAAPTSPARRKAGRVSLGLRTRRWRSDRNGLANR
ncbi:MAG: hypothetical protein ACKO9Z_18995, partial [Planctomycetota bacterium]